MPPKETPAAAAAKAPEPELGLQRSRLGASAVMYAIAIAVLYQRFDASGVFGLAASHLRVLSPWEKACGHLDAKEFVLLSSRVLQPRGEPAPGAGEAGGGGGRAGAGLALHALCSRR